MDILAGQTIKGYALHDCIGQGAFGVVYRAHQAVVEREVAIKVILPQYANQPDFVRRFETEAQLVARLEHIHIVPLYDYWRDPTGAYLVMRYLRGGNLREWVKSGPLSPEQALRVMEQVARALGLAHQHAIIHRDIKPTNILLDEERNAFLTDFGLAKVMGIESTEDAIRGTPEYISPEQIQGQAIGPQADLYSMGLILYEMLAGVPAFRPSSMAEMVELHLNTPVPDITDQRDDVPATINDVIQTATAKTPSDRYADALALARALREAWVAAPDVQIETAAPLIEPLTDREHDVLHLMAQGLSNREIGEQLVIALSTVKWYVRQIYGKLGVTKRRQALVAAQHLKLLEAEPGAAVPADLALPEWMVGENPYKGLEAFQQADAANFFGREALVEHLVACLHEDGELNHFLAVVGPSGSGKSSVVRAGLLPALVKGAVPGSEDWFVVDMLPGVRPLDELTIKLVQKAIRPVPDLINEIQRDAHGLTRAARMALPDDGTLLLVVDQFEELFTLVEDLAVARHFLSLIHAAVTDSRSNVHVIITLRADLFDRPLVYPDFYDIMRHRTEIVGPLTAEELEATIVRPAEHAGVLLEPGLVAALVAEVGEQPGTLPLLEYALTELFDRREGRTITLTAYHDLGGALGALARRADDLFDDLADIERQAARQLFLRVVTLGEGTEDVRRRVLRSELEAVDVERAVMEDVIDAFGEDRLLTFDFDPATREPTVEVAHEALIQRWGRLRSWLDASRDDMRVQRMLGTAAKDWCAAEQDTDFLLRGSRLAQFEEWADQTDIALTGDERVFLESSITEEAIRTARRRRNRRFAVAAISIIAVIMTVLAIIALLFAQDADRSKEDAHYERDRAQELALVSGAREALAKDDLDTAFALAVAANRGENPSAQAQTVLSEAVYQPGPVRTFKNFYILCVDISPDGRLFLAARDNNVIISDMRTGEEIHVLEGPAEGVGCVGFSPDGTKAYSRGQDATITLWDVETGEMLHHLGGGLILNSENISAVFSPDGRYLLSTNSGRPGRFEGEEAYLILWDVETGKPNKILRGHNLTTGGIDISPDGTKALSGAEDELILWNLETGEIIQRLPNNDPSLLIPVTVRFRPDGRTALVRYWSGPMVLWDLETYQVIRRFSEQYVDAGGWKVMALSPDGKIAAGGSMGIPTGTDLVVLELWDVDTGTWIMNLPVDAWGVDFSSDGNYLLVAAEGDVQLWDLRNGPDIRQIDPQLDLEILGELFLSPDGSSLINNDLNCVFHVLDIATGERIRKFASHEVTDEPLPGCPEPRDDDLYLGSETLRILKLSTDGRIVVWDAVTGQQVSTFTGHVGPWVAVFSPDGRTVLSGDANGTLILWDVATGQEIRRFIGHRSLIYKVIFSPDGQTAFSSAAGTSVIQWDLATGQIVRQFVKSGGRYEHAIALSPDGQTLLSTGEGSLVNVWDVATGTLQKTLSGHGSPVVRFAFSPDGRSVFSTEVDSITIQWDVVTGEAVRRYPIGWLGRQDVLVHPDGHSLLSRELDGKLIQWRSASIDELMAWMLNNRAVRELTCTERELYNLEPRCDDQGAFPTRTPYLTLEPVVAATSSPIVSSLTATQVMTPTPTVIPRPVLTAQVGSQQGQVAINDYQTWEYHGYAGESLTIQVNADQPCNDSQPTSSTACLDTLVFVKAPDGTDMNFYHVISDYFVIQPPESNDIAPGTNTDSRIGNLLLPVDGTYRITVSGNRYETGGAYTLILESQPAARPTPFSTDTPTP